MHRLIEPGRWTATPEVSKIQLENARACDPGRRQNLACRSGYSILMSTTLPITPDALLGERDRLEGLLQASEDWRALGQLRARHGDDLTAVSAARLEALLLGALAENPFYQRYTSVAAALERCGNGIAQYGSSHANGGLNGAGPEIGRAHV